MSKELFPLAPHARALASDPVSFAALRREILTRPDGTMLSYRALTRIAGVSLQHVAGVMRGERKPSFAMGLRLASAIGISPYRFNEYLEKVRSIHPESRRKYLRQRGLKKLALPLAAPLDSDD